MHRSGRATPTPPSNDRRSPAGSRAEEVREALALADIRQRGDEAMVPVRSTAKRLVLGAYGLVWLLFAIPYLLRSTTYGSGPLAQGILTVSLLLGLAAVVPDHSRLPSGPDARRAAP